MNRSPDTGLVTSRARPRALTRILEDMRSTDARVAKGGIQAACEYLEAGPRMDRTRVRIARGLSQQLGSTDIQVNRWAYKLIALLRNPLHLPYLQAQLAGRDTVPENRSWAVAAMAATDPNYLRRLYDVGDQRTLPYDLSAAMYGNPTGVNLAVRAASNVDDPLAHQWLGLLYGDGRIRLPKSYLRELTASSRPEVAEYAIWGIRKRRELTVEDVDIDPLTIAAQPTNVRRWYYRLVAQDPRARDTYGDQVVTWIESERDSKALEGLARGLQESPKDKYWKDVCHQWRMIEKDPFVLRALGARVPTCQLSGEQMRVDLSLLRHLNVDLALPFGNDAANNPLYIHTRGKGAVIVNYHSDQSVNISGGTIGVVQGAGSRFVGTNKTNNAAVDVAALLDKILVNLDYSPDTDPDLRLEAAQLAEDIKINGPARLENNVGFWRRVRMLTSALRAGASASAASTDLIENLEALARHIPHSLG